MTTNTELITADELLNMPDDGRRYELIKGELIESTPPPGSLHGSVAGNAYWELRSFVGGNVLGRVFAAETGFRISTDPDTVRALDAALVVNERLPEGDLPVGYLPFAPDLLVEVVSPSDRASEVQEKVHMWLDAGAKATDERLALCCILSASMPDCILGFMPDSAAFGPDRNC